MVEEYFEDLSDFTYPPKFEFIVQNNINLVQTITDPSSSRSFHIPLTLEEDDIQIPVMGIFDTGSMKNFINGKFAKKHHLKLTQNKFHLETSAFDGT